MLKIRRFPPTPVLWSNSRTTVFRAGVSAFRDSAHELFWRLFKRTNRHVDQILILTRRVVALVSRIQSHPPRLYYWHSYCHFSCYRHSFSTRFNNSFSAGIVENVENRRLDVGDSSRVCTRRFRAVSFNRNGFRRIPPVFVAVVVRVLNWRRRRLWNHAFPVFTQRSDRAGEEKKIDWKKKRTCGGHTSAWQRNRGYRSAAVTIQCDRPADGWWGGRRRQDTVVGGWTEAAVAMDGRPGVRTGVASGSDSHSHCRRRREEHPKVVETAGVRPRPMLYYYDSPGCAPLSPRETSIRRPPSMPPPPPPTGLPHARDHEPNRTGSAARA